MHHNFIDQYSGLESLLHKLDPRTKIITFLGIILFVLFTPLDASASLFFYGLAVIVLIKVSRLPVRFIVLRSLVITPFVILAVLSLLLSPDGRGGVFFGPLLLKAYTCVLSLIVMVSTTKSSDLLKVFQEARCPALFIMIFSFLYRYIYFFLDEFMRINMALDSRTPERRRRIKAGILANMIGHLFIRSYEVGENVYLAMCSRGYRGSVHTLRSFVFTKRDYAFLTVVFLYLTGARILGFYYA